MMVCPESLCVKSDLLPSPNLDSAKPAPQLGYPSCGRKPPEGPEFGRSILFPYTKDPGDKQGGFGPKCGQQKNNGAHAN